MQIPNKKIQTNSPGKILICGGYLIVNPQYSGLVVNSDTYISCTSELRDTSINSSENKLELPIEIYSKNFNTLYKYILVIRLVDTEFEFALNKENDNRYLEYSVLSAFYFFFAANYNTIKHINLKNIMISNKALAVTIDSDYRFYTYNKENFDKMENPTFKIKTGLGSSSALISSLVSNILILLNFYFCEKFPHESLVRNLESKIKSNIALAAYYANNLAQKKIGSGFDIQACLFGSQVFRRKNISEDINLSMKLNENSFSIYCEVINKYLKNEQYEYQPCVPISNFKKSCLISIECGSDTRIMVGNVIKWAEANKLKDLFDDEYFQEINKIQQQVTQLLLAEKETFNPINLKSNCYELRNSIKVLSKKCEVEIEPDILTNLIDMLMNEDDIIFAVCPGAGGYDSVFVIGNGDDFDSTVERVINTFNSNTTENFKHRAFVIMTDIIDTGTYLKILD